MEDMDGTQLKTVMQEQGRKAVWLADHLGISPSMMSRIMNGSRTLAPEQARKAAAVLGIDPAQLQKEQTNGEPDSTEARIHRLLSGALSKL